MIDANCPHCRYFLSDYIESGIHPTLPVYKELRPQIIRRVLPEFVNWAFRFLERISYFELNCARNSALCISQRGRSNLDYDFLIQNAMYNNLSLNIPWIKKEFNYILPILLEAGLLKSKKYGPAKRSAESYVAFVIFKLTEILPEVHADHVSPKGLYTNLSHLSSYSPQPILNSANLSNERITLRNKDDYMSEILEDGEIPTFPENSPPNPTILDEKDVECSILFG